MRRQAGETPSRRNRSEIDSQLNNNHTYPQLHAHRNHDDYSYPGETRKHTSNTAESQQEGQRNGDKQPPLVAPDSSCCAIL
jgi:hypothetical protein